ncbi:hypothetical protein GM658_25725 [Pseudoduganella eburnea]|uniref:Uncharacterized protein n=2 Tax=Massilia eburnea TaxID=1776165 RepID=A0A6L6QNL6_9BURK|nr:hypothetical protein [Massilia eburnea]
MKFLQARRIIWLMNSANPQEFEPSLGERVTRLEVQVASMHAELRGMIETAVAELKGMIAALSARIDAQNARLDEHSRRMDSLEAHMRKMNTTIIITGLSVALSVIFGVGAINSSLISGMTAAFQAGDGSTRWRATVERDIGELKTKFAEMDARQRRDSAELHKDSAELRDEMREIRKLLERREAAPERGKR